MDKLRQDLEKAVNHFFPAQYEVALCSDTYINIGRRCNSCWGDGAWHGPGPGAGDDTCHRCGGKGYGSEIITIEPCEVDLPCIIPGRKAKGFLVSTWKVYQDSYYDPGYCEQIEIGKVRTEGEAMLLAINSLFKYDHVDPYFERLGDEAYAQSIQEEKELF